MSHLNLMFASLGYGSGEFGAVEYAANQSRIQTGWRYDYTTSRGEARTEDLSAGTSETYLRNLLAESGTLTRLYNNNWSVFSFSQQRESSPSAQSSLNTKKSLPPCIRNYLVNNFGFDASLLDSITFSNDGLPTLRTIAGTLGDLGGVLSELIPGNAVIDVGAITVDDHIYFSSPTELDLSDGIIIEEIAYIAHEATHSQQYRTITGFRAKYLGYFLSNYLGEETFSPGDQGRKKAYQEVPYEQEADDIQRRVLNAGKNPCAPQAGSGKAKVKPRRKKKGRN